MKTIELNNGYKPLETDVYDSGNRYIAQLSEVIVLDKQGAKQLIEVLKEWVGEN